MRCVECGRNMKVVEVMIHNRIFKAYECPKCREPMFDESQFKDAVDKLQAARIKARYEKRMISVGHSLGLTIPKDIVDAMGMKPGHKLTLRPDIAKGIIEIKC